MLNCLGCPSRASYYITRFNLTATNTIYYSIFRTAINKCTNLLLAFDCHGEKNLAGVVSVPSCERGGAGSSSRLALAVSGGTMWWLVVLGQVLLAEGMHLMPERHYGPTTEVRYFKF